MKKLPFYFILFFSFILFSFQDKQLTEKERTDDFLFLYETFKTNYPYFDLVKRKHGVDWLARKDIYLEKVRSATNDSDYIRVIGDILGELLDGHTDLYPTLGYDLFLNSYRGVITERPEYRYWVEALEEKYTSAKYWSAIMNPKASDDNQEDNQQVAQIISNYNDSIIEDKGIAIMNIPSIASELIAIDSLKIENFIDNLHDEKILIINIQGNGGGNTHYWENLIVSRLISDTIEFAQYSAIKKGAVNKKYYSKYFDSDFEISTKDSFYNKIPDYFLNDPFHIAKETIKIAPRNPVKFNGSIYLLVDGSVFSSAEAFAYFSQITGWAIVVGKPTRGDGVGSDPAIISLPESGIKIRFSTISGFNADGSLNAENGTIPDLVIEGKTREERLTNLVNQLTDI